MQCFQHTSSPCNQKRILIELSFRPSSSQYGGQLWTLFHWAYNDTRNFSTQPTLLTVMSGVANDCAIGPMLSCRYFPNPSHFFLHFMQKVLVSFHHTSNMQVFPHSPRVQVKWTSPQYHAVSSEILCHLKNHQKIVLSWGKVNEHQFQQHMSSWQKTTYITQIFQWVGVHVANVNVNLLSLRRKCFCDSNRFWNPSADNAVW